MKGILMNTQSIEWAEPTDPGHPKAPARRTLRFVVGLAAVVGVVLAFYFLFFQGGLLLAVGIFLELISLLGPAQGMEGVRWMLMIPAAMVASGLCISFGLMDVAFRGITRRPLPGRSAVLRFCLISLIFIAATMAAVGLFVGAMRA
ncbi:hypothetical protein OJF2_00650 [Aquisphaera giovannonii]|uniref:Uncharacterized protein n=1 Tax=Aquisphaera giovannonii TaxID=406548 RepID=A0A5B9VUX9_9BACT|nr:hypothetical protein [Aquisphaera giovannonii]QEH31600.1 hypothetical protein OJF2_00650 [Aquisphaera giovannonii]